MTIEFHCPRCDKLLKTSDEKAGCEAKCPGCGDLITVPTVANPSLELTDVESHDTDSSGTEGLEQDTESSDATKSCPFCGETIKAAAVKCRFCGEIVDREKIASRRRDGRREMRPFPPGEVIEESWQLFTESFGLLVGSNLLATVLVYMSLIPSCCFVFLAMLMNEQNNEEAVITSLVAVGVCLLLPLAVLGYLQPGLYLIQLKVAREETTGIQDLFKGGRFFWRLMACGIIVFLLLCIGFAACIVPCIIVIAIFLPVGYVLVDEDSPGIQALWRSKELTDGNWGSLILIWLMSIAIMMAPSFVCSIFGSLLTLVTAPLTSLMFAVAYDRMTCQTPLSEIQRLAEQSEEAVETDLTGN